LAQHAAIVESNTNCFYIPEDASAVAGAKKVMLAAH